MAVKKAEKKTDKKAEKKTKEIRQSAWEKYDKKALDACFALSETYRQFISDCKTERECVDESIRQAEKAGYKNLADFIGKKKKLKAGDKVYMSNMGRAIALFVIGKKPMVEGLNILCAHIDSPRIDAKQVPLYEDTEIAMLDTHYYGGIKKYQWVTLPLAIHGVVVKEDGKAVNICIGEEEEGPVIGITDLLIHLSADQMQKTAAKVVEGEDLNVMLGSMPLKGEEKEAVKANILKILKDKYGIEEEDFISADLEIVPAGKAKHYGLDSSMIMGYGQDDRVCAYTSLKAILDAPVPSKTACCLLVDKEEIGSVGATGMESRFFENVVAEVMNLVGEYNELDLRRALANSRMLSSDVSAAFDPNYPGVNEKKNTAYFGKGIVFNKYTGSRGKSGSNEASAEYMAVIRKIMKDNNVTFQTAELGKVDQGGGGTIAYIAAAYNMEVIDSGVAVMNMHAPWEISCKADIYEAYLCYKAFLKDA